MSKKLTISEQKTIINRFINGESIADISNSLNRDQSAIGRMLRKHGLKTDRNIDKNIKNQIAGLYLSGLSLNEIAIKLNINSITVWKHCKKHNIKLRPVGSKLEIKNPNFFKKLNMNSAYVLGLFIADGCLQQRKRKSSIQHIFSIGLKKQDMYMIENIKNFLGSQHTISIIKNMASISIIDENLCKSITDWGIPKTRKTYNLSYCKKLFTILDNKNLLSSFVRGYLDGDGSIYVSKNKYYHKVSFTAYSNKFLSTLNDFIMKNLDITRGYFYKKNNSNTHSLSFSGGKKIRKLLAWIYSDKSNLFLERKNQKWLAIMNSK